MIRRHFLKSAVSLAALSSLPAKSLAKSSTWLAQKTTDDWPIAQLNDNQSYSEDFNGDNINRPHDILWNIDGYINKKGGEPEVTEELDVVIVGGGVAGLSAAYYLRDKKIALLEQDLRLGGNSKGEIYNQACYSIGAAYLVEPSKDSPLDSLFNELNINDQYRVESGSDTSVFFNRAFTSPFWEGASDLSARQDFIKFHKRLTEIYNDEDFSFEGNFAKQYDDLSAAQWLQKEFGDVHPHIKEYMQLYGWSSFCGSIDELSAFQYLGFLAAETGDVAAFPGGNSYIALKLSAKVRKARGMNALRSGCIVLKVETHGDSVTVLYENSFGSLKKIRAGHVIMSCPKFVAEKLIPEMDNEQRKAIAHLSYRAYLVANLITDNAIQSPSYELYCLQGKMPPTPTAMNRGNRSFSDICFGTWAQQDQLEHSVLTLYHGLAFDGARQFLFNPSAHEKYKNLYLKDAEPILNSLGLTADNVHGIRLTRWGHALPLSRTGLLNAGYPQLASSSINNRIHFANQDNWMNPCIETAHLEALNVVSNIR